jgi:hypothetical protein
MSQFIQKYEEKITGTLSGWDRIVFRGTLRMLCFVDGMMGYRALRPWSEEDQKLLEVLSDGAFAVQGFCNRDLARRLYPSADDDPAQRARITSKVSYRLRILRAHGLIRKSPRQRRYHVTTKGRGIITALCRSQHITLQQLNATAA